MKTSNDDDLSRRGDAARRKWDQPLTDLGQATAMPPLIANTKIDFSGVENRLFSDFESTGCDEEETA